MNVSAQPVQLVAADGYRLAAHSYPASASTRAQLVVAGATGVPLWDQVLRWFDQCATQ